MEYCHENNGFDNVNNEKDLHISRVIRRVVYRWCKKTDLTIDHLSGFMDVPTMTLRRYGYSSIIVERSTCEMIRNPNHINITLQKLLKLFEITEDWELLECIAYQFGARIIKPNNYIPATKNKIFKIIRTLLKIAEQMDDGPVRSLKERILFLKLSDMFSAMGQKKNIKAA